VNCGARKQQQQMDPGRGCPAQIPDRGQYVHSSHRSEVEEVGRRRKDPREHTAHTEETGTGRAEGEEMMATLTKPWTPEEENKLQELILGAERRSYCEVAQSDAVGGTSTCKYASATVAKIEPRRI
jgi:hypothetical protein